MSDKRRNATFLYASHLRFHLWPPGSSKQHVTFKLNSTWCIFHFVNGCELCDVWLNSKPINKTVNWSNWSPKSLVFYLSIDVFFLAKINLFKYLSTKLVHDVYSNLQVQIDLPRSCGKFGTNKRLRIGNTSSEWEENQKTKLSFCIEIEGVFLKAFTAEFKPGWKFVSINVLIVSSRNCMYTTAEAV